MTKSVMKNLAALITVIVAILVSCETVSAQEPITKTLLSGIEIGGLDIVFLIDNSSSMYAKVDECSGEVIDDTGNDEKMLRLDSVRHVIKRLLLYNLRIHKGVEHRVGVITFGGPNASTIDLKLELLKTDSEEAMDRRFEYLAGRLSKDLRGDTHPIEAFEKAADMWAAAPSIEEPQVKAIILLTDGRPHIGMTPISGIRPCVGGKPNPEFDKEYFAELSKLIGRELPVATEHGSTEGYHIWVVAMNEDWEDIRPYWEDIIGNRWRRISSASQIPGTFNDILEQIYPLASILIKPSFCMPPYLDSAAFSVFASEPIAISEVITFYRQDGSQLLPSDPDVRRYEEIGNSIIWIEVRRPEPGAWRYETQPDRTVQVRFDPMLGQMEMIEPGGIQSQLSSARLAFQLYDLNGSPMKEHNRFPLILEGTVSSPGMAQPLPLAFDPEGEGRYVSQEEIPLRFKGEYLVGIEGYAIDSCNEKWIVVPPQTHKFTVGPVEPHFVPPDGSVTPVTALMPELELRGPGNEPVKVALEVQDEVVMKAWFYRAGSDPLDGTELEMGHQDGTRFVATQEVCGLPVGDYRIKVQGWLEADGEKPIDLFTVDEQAFTVAELTATLSSPVGAQQPFRPVEVHCQLSSSNLCTDVHLRLHVTTPSGQSKTIDMTPAPAGNGRFIASLFLNEAARQPYVLEAEGWLMTPEGRMELFRTTDNIIADTLHLNLTKPATEKPQNTQVEIVYEVRVHTADGQLFVEDPQHPLSMKATVTTPSNTQEEVLLNKKMDGVYGGSLLAREEGSYQVALLGTVLDSDGKPVEAVHDEQGRFLIYPTTAVKLAIVQPQPGARLQIRTSPRIPLVPNTGPPTEVDLAMELSDAQGKPVDPDLITTHHLDELLVFQLLDATGMDLGSDLLFEKASSSNNRLKATTDKLVEEGEYTFEACLDDSVFSKEYVPIQGQTCDRVTFERHDPTVTTTRAIAGGEAVAALVLAGAIAWGLWSVTNPVRGELVFMLGEESFSIPLGRRRRRVVNVGPQDFSHPDLSKVTVQRASGVEEDEEILLSAWDSEGLPITKDERIMDGDSPIPLVGDVRVQYRYTR